MTSNWGIIGHENAVSLLAKAISTERLSHAYLLAGPRQTGKTALALAFARALHCSQSPTPCGQCRPCRMIDKGLYPDVQVLRLDAVTPSNRSGKRSRPKNIPIVDVRALLRDAALAPYEGRWKVYIIRYSEDLSLEGIQALLKTLEEPEPHVILTLTAADAKILPPTIVSRCQQIGVGPVPAAEIAGALRERFDVAAERAELLAHLSEGRVGWAIAAAKDERVERARADQLTALTRLVVSGRHERLEEAERLAASYSRDAEATVGTLQLWLGWWRDVTLSKEGVSERIVNRDRRREIAEHAAAFRLPEVIGAMKAVVQTLTQLQQNANPRLAMEVLLLSLPVGAG